MRSHVPTLLVLVLAQIYLGALVAICMTFFVAADSSLLVARKK